jgi:hypothetical protein
VSGVHIQIERMFEWFSSLYQNRIVLENPKAAVPSLSPSYEKHHQPYYSNRELLYQLFDMAVGIRNFKVQEAKTMIAELVGEVKKRRSHTKRTVIKRSSDCLSHSSGKSKDTCRDTHKKTPD